MATTRPRRFAGESAPSIVNAPVLERILDGIEEVAVHVIGDAPWTEDALVEFRDHMSGLIQREVITFASAQPETHR